MVILYWTIGKIIKTGILKDERAEYGKSIIKELSIELVTILNDLKALSKENKMSTDLFFRDPYVLDFLGL